MSIHDSNHHLMFEFIWHCMADNKLQLFGPSLASIQIMVTCNGIRVFIMVVPVFFLLFWLSFMVLHLVIPTTSSKERSLQNTN